MTENRSPDDLSTKSLIRRGRAGDAWALDQLFGRLTRAVRRWAHGRLPSKARRDTDTVDIVQEAAIGVLRRLDRLDLTSRGDLEAYLRQAARNRILDEVRRCGRVPELESVDPGHPASEPSPVECAMNAEDLRRYRSALSRLSADDQACLVARLELGYSHEEIAELLGKPSAEAARMAVTRAFGRLSSELRE